LTASPENTGALFFQQVPKEELAYQITFFFPLASISKLPDRLPET
jgi:hypothetical protein